MTEIINLEVQFFLTSILYGILLLVVYDSIRIIRRIVPHKAFFIAVEDLLFWIVASIVIFLMIYEKNNGTIRGFAILGMLLGMIIYNQLLSRLVVKGITWLLKTIIKGIRKLLHVIFRPFAFLFRKGAKGFRAVSGKAAKVNHKVTNKMKKVGKSSVKQLKNTAKTVKISVTKK
ncbi:spore cortex biosynthesis protein YabQ [Anaerosporobacter faecicola]|uniref:spore cortex biosynthesis protein YabQ n=1 Tax=Anaerosporobacter faecicola TaxID=2718714 RepID=UPI00143BB7CD|nr:spore cortex biosynthesis protein YabQ [Anaerosporobacter faecicola]